MELTGSWKEFIDRDASDLIALYHNTRHGSAILSDGFKENETSDVPVYFSYFPIAGFGEEWIEVAIVKSEAVKFLYDDYVDYGSPTFAIPVEIANGLDRWLDEESDLGRPVLRGSVNSDPVPCELLK